MVKKVTPPIAVEPSLDLDDVLELDIPELPIEEVLRLEPQSLITQTNSKVPTVYVTNKALLVEFKLSKEKGEMTKELAKMVMLICERYARRGSYANYTYNEDLQSFALMNLVKSWKSFNPEKSQNPFAYFTSCIHNSFLQYLNQERKHRNIRDALLIENGLDPSHTYTGAYVYTDSTTTEPTNDKAEATE